MDYIQMDTVDVNDKRVLVREDFNVPIQNGSILNDARLKAAIPTIEKLIEKNARIIIISHLGRPVEGQYTESLSLKPVAERLSQLLDRPVRLEKEWLTGVSVAAQEIVLCENVRFNLGEKANDFVLAKKMAALCDVFVMDAFATAHRAEASTVGVAQYAPMAVVGPLLSAELNALTRALHAPQKPVIAIVGGSKISSKLQILESLLSTVDTLILGGGIANTFIALQYSIGDSLYESECIKLAQNLLNKALLKKVNIIVPIDAIVAEEISMDAKTRISDLSDIQSNEKIVDVGPSTSEQYNRLLKEAGTIIWNGPVGVFEQAPFSQGTQRLAEAIAASAAFSIAGGGETVAAIDKYGVGSNISYISTGGGAFLEYIEGKTLPAVAILQAKGKQQER